MSIKHFYEQISGIHDEGRGVVKRGDRGEAGCKKGSGRPQIGMLGELLEEDT